MASRPPDAVSAYARGVVAGRIVAGPYVRAACRRHLADLKRRDWRWRFSLVAAQRTFDFFAKVLRLNGGEFEGAPFVLTGWQAFVVGSLFGWIEPATRERRFRVAYVEAGKGNGKSPLAAGI